MTRRGAMMGVATIAAGGWSPGAWAAGEDALAALEARHGGRLGVALLDANGEVLTARRGDERFAMCSTHKLLSAALVLSRVDARQESLARRVIFSAQDLVTYSPATERAVGGEGMTLEAICAAAITLSDNTAGNLLFDSFGGPAALTAYLRTLGDEVTRSDRIELALNDVPPGEERDTTTPLAMARLMRTLLLSDALAQPSRAKLAQWLIDNKTGDRRLRAGLPPAWRVGDKTGTGGRAETNDVAILWPPEGRPLILTAYYVEADAPAAQRDAVLADVARALVRA
jgi:beta-lactamase class A